CPHHGFLELHQLDTFYNALTTKDQDSLNSAAGGNFLDKMPSVCLSIIESKSKFRYSCDKTVAKVSTNASTSGVSPDVAELKDLVRVLLLDKKVNYNQGNTGYRPQMMSNQIRPPGFPPVANNQNVPRNNQNRFTPNQNQDPWLSQVVLGKPFVEVSTMTRDLSLGVVKFTNRTNDISYKTTHKIEQYNSLSDLEKEHTKRNDERNREKAKDQIEKFYQIFKDMSFEISFPDALILMPKFASTLKALIENKEKLSEMARTPLNEHCYVVLLKKLPEKLRDPGKFLIPCDFPGMAECLALADLGAIINLMPYSMWKRLSLPELTPTCMTLELSNRLISRSVGVAEDVYVKAGSFHFPADFVVVDFDADPRVPLILERSFLKTKIALIDVYGGELTLQVGKEAITFNLDQTSSKELKICEAKTDKSSVDEPPTVELKVLPPHLEYAFLEGDDKLPVIIAKDLSVEEKATLITVLKFHKRAIAWKLSDIKGINPEFCTHKILLEEDFTPAV
nr:reverse transcriptase domain-containing protein [Tanacetum cinerariifolium]